DWLGSVAGSPDGKRALTGCGMRVLLWDVESGRELRALNGHTDSVHCVAFSPDGRRALSAEKVLRFWDVESGQQLRCLKGHTHGINSVAFSPDGRHAVSGSADWTVRLWDLAANEPRGRVFLKSHTDTISSVAFAPDSRTLASAGE